MSHTFRAYTEEKNLDNPSIGKQPADGLKQILTIQCFISQRRRCSAMEYYGYYSHPPWNPVGQNTKQARQILSFVLLFLE
jgi:hypothetical protein